MKNFIQRFKNAHKIIAQIRANEWEPVYSDRSNCCVAACRENLHLWLSGDSWFCDIVDDNLRDMRCFGLFWRHYVWWAAARHLKAEANNKYKKRYNQVPVL